MEYACGNVFIREMVLDRAGQVVDGHAHNFDHTTYCARGSMRVDRLADDGGVVDQVELRADAPVKAWVLIKAGVRHRITALQDGTIGHCIYAHRTPQGDVVQAHTGWAPGYE